VVPEVRGMNKVAAIDILMKKNISYDSDNNGVNIINMMPLPGTVVKEGAKVKLTTGITTNFEKIVIMPDFKGYSKDKVTEITKNLGITTLFKGDGVVSDQDVKAGTQVHKGSTVNFQLQKSVD